MNLFLGCSFFYLQADFDPHRDILVSSSPNPPREGNGGKIQIWDPLTFEKALEFACQVRETYQDPFHLSYFYDSVSDTYKILTNVGSRFNIYTVGSDEVITSDQRSESLINTFGLVQSDLQTTVLVGDRDGYVSEYGVDGSFIRQFGGCQSLPNSYGITCFAMYCDGKSSTILFSGSCNGTVYARKYDENEDFVNCFSQGQAVTSLAVFKDETGVNVIAGTSGLVEEGYPVGQLVCWNVDQKKELYRVAYDSSGFNSKHQDQQQWGFVNGLILVQDEPDYLKLVTIANDSGIKIWDAQTGVCMQTLVPDGESQDTRNWVMDIKPFRKNETLYLVAAYYSGDVLFWNTKTGACEACSSLGQSKTERTLPRAIVIFERDQKLYACASGDSQNIVTWDLDTYEVVNQVQGNNNTEWCLATNQQAFGKGSKVQISHDSSPGLGYRVPIFNLQMNL